MRFNSPARWLTAAAERPTDMCSSSSFVARLPSRPNRPWSSQPLKRNPPPSEGAGISCPTWGEIKGEEDGGPEAREQRRTFSGSFRRVRRLLFKAVFTGVAVERCVCTCECQCGGMLYTAWERKRERERGRDGETEWERKGEQRRRFMLETSEEQLFS